jgi:hypothetical protein
LADTGAEEGAEEDVKLTKVFFVLFLCTLFGLVAHALGGVAGSDLSTKVFVSRAGYQSDVYGIFECRRGVASVT